MFMAELPVVRGAVLSSGAWMRLCSPGTTPGRALALVPDTVFRAGKMKASSWIWVRVLALVPCPFFSTDIGYGFYRGWVWLPVRSYHRPSSPIVRCWLCLSFGMTPGTSGCDRTGHRLLLWNFGCFFGVVVRGLVRTGVLIPDDIFSSWRLKQRRFFQKFFLRTCEVISNTYNRHILRGFNRVVARHKNYNGGDNYLSSSPLF